MILNMSLGRDRNTERSFASEKKTRLIQHALKVIFGDAVGERMRGLLRRLDAGGTLAKCVLRQGNGKDFIRKKDKEKRRPRCVRKCKRRAM